jgi:hypothetical protein
VNLKQNSISHLQDQPKYPLTLVPTAPGALNLLNKQMINAIHQRSVLQSTLAIKRLANERTAIHLRTLGNTCLSFDYKTLICQIFSGSILG